MKSFFSALTRLSLRLRAVVLALIVIVAALGVVAWTQLKQELIPPIEFPGTVILAQTSGLTSDQVLNILTIRLEDELAQIPALVNVESTTTGAFGVVIQTSNEFGLDQDRVRADIQAAIDRVWLPLRHLAPPDGVEAEAFANARMAELTPDILIYLAERDPNFLFQLTPAVWAALPDETIRITLAYLAAQVEDGTAERDALRALVDQTIIPRLEALDSVADVSVGGGQTLPGEAAPVLVASLADELPSLLLQLPRSVWAVVGPRLGLDTLDGAAVGTLSAVPFSIPQTPPTLPPGWQVDHFADASDLLEMRTLTRSLAGVLNQLYETGQIVGALGQTNDLSPEIIARMLVLDPSLVETFTAEHLAAMSPEVFAALPDDYVAGLDGFTRDALAAAALAGSITGEIVPPEPVDLPSAWRIQPPQIVSFSFDDIPVATYSVFTNQTGAPVIEAASEISEAPDAPADDPQAAPVAAARDIPEGPPLPFFFGLLGGQFGVELNSADDLIDIQLPPDFAEQLGADQISAADFLNFLILLSDPESLPPGVEVPALPFDLAALVTGLSGDAVGFIAEYDPGFLGALSPGVYDRFSDTVLSQPQIAPPLADVWNALARQPQFAAQPLSTAADLLRVGDGSAASVLNTIDATVPERFSGYEVRLFDSLSPATLRYLNIHEPDFYAQLDESVLLKFNPQTLATLPNAARDALSIEAAEQIAAITDGRVSSAAQALADRYRTEVPPGDPDAPALNEQWRLLEPFYNIELNSADDFFRFPQNFPFEDAAGLMNSVFNNAQGASFAPNLFGNLSIEAVQYMLSRDPNIFDGVRLEVLQNLSAPVVALLPRPVQDRLLASEEPFVPVNRVTRTNGSSSLLVAIFKSREANTVDSFLAIDAAMRQIDAENDSISIEIALETASFVQDSITGVAREGSLGAIFAFIIILIFLSDGVWARPGRRMVGTVMIGGFSLALALLIFTGLEAAGGDWGRAFATADTVVRVLLIGGIIVGLVIRFWPGPMPVPAWRSTIVTTVSIPLSILTALALMNWLPPVMWQILGPYSDSPVIAFILRLFPTSLTLNIMTLSGLTVAIGRVVDDSIVVLENIFREIQAGGDKRRAIITGARDVSVAIFSATLIVVVVFLPLGLTGGLISEFFLPFGLAVTYALVASFLVALSVVPVLAYLLVDERDIFSEDAGPIAGRVATVYLPILEWALSTPIRRLAVVIIAISSVGLSVLLFSARPLAFLPEFGEPEIAINFNLPAGTRITETNVLALQMEAVIEDTIPTDDLGTVRTTVGGGGVSLDSLLGTDSIDEARGQISISLRSPALLETYTRTLRNEAEAIFGVENVQVSAASLADAAFGGFQMIVSGPQEVLATLDATIIEALNSIDGLANASSNLSTITASGGGGDGPITYIRVNQQSALSYTAELETENTIGVTQQAIAAVQALDLPAGISVSEGFESQVQTEGFTSLFSAMAIAIVIVIAILIVAFNSLVHWFTLILSVIVAPVGAAIALTLTNEVLGISALIGLLMLIGLVVTNAIVLIDRVQSNRRERAMDIHDALMEAGARRLRPIIMTTLATIIALIPLSVGLSDGAIIAAQLGIVVIGGVTSSMLLTLIVVPVAYRILDPLHQWVAARVRPARVDGRAPQRASMD